MKKKSHPLHIYIYSDEEKEIIEKIADLIKSSKTKVVRILLSNFFKKNAKLLKNLDKKENAEKIIQKLFFPE